MTLFKIHLQIQSSSSSNSRVFSWMDVRLLLYHINTYHSRSDVISLDSPTVQRESFMRFLSLGLAGVVSLDQPDLVENRFSSHSIDVSYISSTLCSP